nr:MAG TPA: hypothetical protein [Caudoviricetes sp.]
MKSMLLSPMQHRLHTTTFYYIMAISHFWLILTFHS